MVHWFHDGDLVSTDERHTIENADGESTLKISDTKRPDRGEYTVKGYNKLGEHLSSFLVTITGTPN